MYKKQWLVAYTKARCEKKVTDRLCKLGIEAYCPLVTTLRQWSDRKKKVVVPMFNSYIFLNINEKDRIIALQDPGVMNFLFYEKKPALVRDIEIDALKKIEENGYSVEVKNEGLELGKKMEIDEGPFKGMNGTIDKLNDNKVTLIIEQLGCNVTFNYKKNEF